MADRMAAHISIGGDIPESLLGELCEVLEQQGVSTDWGENSSWSPGDIVKNADGVLRAFDIEVAWGQFDQLEPWLQEHNIPYIRTTEGKYEYDGEVVWWIPGMEEPEEVSADQSGNPTVTVTELKEIHSMEELQALIRESEPPNLPPLNILRGA